MIVSCILTIGTTTHDVSSLVKRDGLEVRWSVGGPDYKPSVDSAKIVLAYDLALAHALLSATDTVKIKLKIDGVDWFTGRVRPTSSLVVRNAAGDLTLECLDASYLLDRPLASRKVLTQKPIYQGSSHIIGELISGTGVVVSASAPVIDTIIPQIAFDEGANILALLTDLLYYQGYTLFFDQSGELAWRSWIMTSVVPSYIFSESHGDILDEVEMTREELSKHDGVELTFSRITSFSKAEVCHRPVHGDIAQATQNGSDVLSETLHFSWPYSFTPITLTDLRLEGESASVDDLFSFKIERKRQTFHLPLQAGAAGGGVRITSATVNANKTSGFLTLRAENWGYWGVALFGFKIYASGTAEESGKVVRSTAGAKSNPAKITARFLQSDQIAQDLADSYYINVISNPYTVRLDSYTDRPVGEIVTVNVPTGGWSLDGVIYAKTYDSRQRLYRYKIRAISAITPATASSSSLPSDLPMGSGVPDELIIGPSDAPAAAIYVADMAEINRGLVVRSGGKELLRLGHILSPTLRLHKTVIGLDLGDDLLSLAVGSGVTYACHTLKAVILKTDGTVTVYTSADFGSGMEPAFFYAVALTTSGPFWVALRASDGSAWVVDQSRAKVGISFATFSVMTFTFSTFTVHPSGRLTIHLDGKRFTSDDSGATWSMYDFGTAVIGGIFDHHLFELTGHSLYRDGEEVETGTFGSLVFAYSFGGRLFMHAWSRLFTISSSGITSQPLPSGAERSVFSGSAFFWHDLSAQKIKRVKDLFTETPAEVLTTSNAKPFIIPLSDGQIAIIRPYLLTYAIDFYDTVELDIGGAAIPAGTIQAYGGTSAPLGWLPCQGQKVSRTEYSRLFAAIGTTWGPGDGVTTFNLPDLREVALVGSGTSARPELAQDHDIYSVGQYKNDQLQQHAHPKGNDSNGENYQYGTGNQSGFSGYWNRKTGGVVNIDGNSPRVGTVTRGKRVGVLYIIKT